MQEYYSRLSPQAQAQLDAAVTQAALFRASVPRLPSVSEITSQNGASHVKPLLSLSSRVAQRMLMFSDLPGIARLDCKQIMLGNRMIFNALKAPHSTEFLPTRSQTAAEYFLEGYEYHPGVERTHGLVRLLGNDASCKRAVQLAKGYLSWCSTQQTIPDLHTAIAGWSVLTAYDRAYALDQAILAEAEVWKRLRRMPTMLLDMQAERQKLERDADKEFAKALPFHAQPRQGHVSVLQGSSSRP